MQAGCIRRGALREEEHRIEAEKQQRRNADRKKPGKPAAP
jgi:hypothetical protein